LKERIIKQYQTVSKRENMGDSEADIKRNKMKSNGNVG
jgi:hypothetical protein